MAVGHYGNRAGLRFDGGMPKVPAVRPYFWAVKLLTTAMGEALSDFVVLDVNKYLGVVLGFAVFAAALWWQFRTPEYRTWPYWTAVSMVAVFGTMAADVMHVVLGLPYATSTAFYAVCLAVTFIAWYRSEGTLDIHSVTTPRREVFYWLAVVFTFAMGTAVGDMTATTVHLGYLASAFLFAGMICVPLAAWRLGASPVLTFWVAYVLTRPVGASFADFFGMPKDISGMGYGHGAVAAVTLAVVLASIWYVGRTRIDAPMAAAAPAVPVGAWPGLGRPEYGQPEYGQPEYGQPEYGQAEHGRPEYGQAEQGPWYGQRPDYGYQARPQFHPTQGYGQGHDGRPPWD